MIEVTPKGERTIKTCQKEYIASLNTGNAYEFDRFMRRYLGIGITNDIYKNYNELSFEKQIISLYKLIYRDRDILSKRTVDKVRNYLKEHNIEAVYEKEIRIYSIRETLWKTKHATD